MDDSLYGFAGAVRVALAATASFDAVGQSTSFANRRKSCCLHMGSLRYLFLPFGVRLELAGRTGTQALTFEYSSLAD